MADQSSPTPSNPGPDPMTPTPHIKGGEADLLPCPFCGSGAHVLTYPPRHPYTTDEYGAACQSMGRCIAGSICRKFAKLDWAVEAWNRRAAPPPAAVVSPTREEVERIIRDAFAELLAGEYNPAMQGYQHRQANKEAAKKTATDRLLALFSGAGR